MTQRDRQRNGVPARVRSDLVVVDPSTAALASHDDEPDERRYCDAWRWAPPLEQFLGDEEPSDDDAVDWIMRDLVPRGEPFLFGGAWKSGKTWTAIALAVCIALGVPFVGFENTLGRPGRVLVIALEDGRRRLRKRVWAVLRGMALTPNDPTLRANLRVWDEVLRLPGDQRTREQFVAEMERWKPDVILIDSLTRAMTGSQNDIRDATAFTAAWRELSVKLGASIGFIHHTNKSNGDDKRGTSDLFDRMRGSGELLAAPRNLIVMERLGTDGSKVSAVSMRGNLDLRRTSFALEWRQETRADGRIAVTLHDRGEPEDVRRELAGAVKAVKASEKQVEHDRVTRAALLIANERGAVSAATLGLALAVDPRTAAKYIANRRDLGLLGDTGDNGSSITDAGRAWLTKERS
jgi:hypothetical protein